MNNKPLIDEEESQFLMQLLSVNGIRGNILEIGSYSCDGSTPIFVGHIRKHDGMLHCVDIFSDQSFEEKCRKLLKGLDARVFKGYSVELSAKSDTIYQFAFIDGDHGFPRVLPNNRQSGVACDLLAWHPRIKIGGIVAFHDYTGDQETYGNIKYLPIEYAVDTLCTTPYYEFIGKVGSIIAFRKLRDGVLFHTHRLKCAPAQYRDKWRLLDTIRPYGRNITVFGSQSAATRVVESLNQTYLNLLKISFCNMNVGDAKDVRNTDLDIGYTVFRRDMLASDDLIITAGTVKEEEQLLKCLNEEESGLERCVTFMEWFGWYHLGRYGYLQVKSMNIPVNTVKSNLHPTQFQVVIPCYNCGEYIDQCLDSLLAQTFSNWTALVADDASTDTTVERVQPYLADPRMSLLASPERRYLMGNTLTALRSLDLGPREVVAILDGDDWIRPTCLEKIWEKHCQGYDFVYTDEDIQDQNYSFGGAILTSVPVRQQSWRFSHLRSFKAYLFRLLNDDAFRDARGEYFRAACDLALHLPMAELAGPEKVHFIREKLYHYRVHENCNFKVLRQEQLNNNWFIRSRPAEILQTMHFDFIETVTELSKHETDVLCKRVRDKYPSPFTVAVEHVIPQSEVDSWRAYHNLWIGNGIFLMSKEKSIGV